jgi:large subunit ribosomal protein L17
LQKAKRAQPLIERLISLGKDGSVHARRRAFRHLQDRDLVKKLFAEIAPRFIETNGGYTRILKLSNRLGDGAQLALLELTKLPVEKPKTPPKSKKEVQETPSEQVQEKAAKSEEEGVQKPKKFFEGIRGLFRPKKGTDK